MSVRALAVSRVRVQRIPKTVGRGLALLAITNSGEGVLKLIRWTELPFGSILTKFWGLAGTFLLHHPIVC
jgi:hypothetical protein